jgi:hypothetical protein
MKKSIAIESTLIATGVNAVRKWLPPAITSWLDDFIKEGGLKEPYVRITVETAKDKLA